MKYDHFNRKSNEILDEGKCESAVIWNDLKISRFPLKYAEKNRRKPCLPKLRKTLSLCRSRSTHKKLYLVNTIN